ncbi:phosphonate ABC transporter ATP-binding protein [Megasphaera sp. UBA4382]|uniref:phosphonate ABC transporter ATP-binding protein n=1 Tax=Megasphaera sp. UBA4382 TaxID=1946850 RepID=UPI0025BACBEE|nr:phosphonate ABC transporter ATP-binding protein [Megasphaera sp. UBA4382]
MAMLELKHVCQSYKKQHPVLRDISLSIPTGQFVSVIGPSGAGKTTLLRLFNHMVRPDSGEVWIDGTRFDRLNGRGRRKIQQRVGMIFQDFSLVDMCTCLQNVLNGSLARVPLWRALSGCFPQAEKEKAMAALKAVGLESYSQTPAHALSGGQKQRVAIARTLMQDATILLADEPVASLDPLTARQVLELMRRLQQKQGLTVVMNSHNVEQARTWSDRIIGLKDGSIFFDGPPADWTDDRLQDLYGRTQS